MAGFHAGQIGVDGLLLLFARPCAFAVGSKQRSRDCVWRVDDKLEAGADTRQSLRRLGSGLGKRRRGQSRGGNESWNAVHRFLSFRLWLSEAFSVIP